MDNISACESNTSWLQISSSPSAPSVKLGTCCGVFTLPHRPCLHLGHMSSRDYGECFSPPEVISTCMQVSAGVSLWLSQISPW